MPDAKDMSVPERPNGDFEERQPLWIESTFQDLRFALRTLRKSPAFTTAAILTLALGIGANAAIFQLLNAVRLRSLPVPNPSALAVIQIKGGNPGFGISETAESLSYPIWEQVRRQQQGFSAVFSWFNGLFSSGEGAQRKVIKGFWISGEGFPTLGITPLRGRLFTMEDDQPGCGTPGVVISYGLWQSEFGGQDSAIGAKIAIRGHPIEVIGVTPPEFFGLEVGTTFDVVLPNCSLETLYPKDNITTRPDLFGMNIMGRLKPGWSLAQASAQLESISPALMEQTLPSGYSVLASDEYRRFRLAAYPGRAGVSSLRKTYDSSLWLLLGITGLVLLIACANLGNLMLARASHREREMAVRLALGATRERIVRQLLSEGLLLSGCGAILGEALASLFSRNLLKIFSAGGDVLPLDLSLDWHVLGFTALVAITTCVVFGLAPAFRLSRADPGAVLKTGGRGMSAGRRKFSFQRMLVVSQIAISLVLLIGALLFVRSFWNLVTLDPGFRENGILLGQISFVTAGVPPERYEIFKQDLLKQIQSLPVVESAAFSTHVPLDGSSWSLGVRSEGQQGSSKFVWVSPAYFATMQIPMIAGRDFNDGDTAQSPPVVIVNETFVRKYFGETNPASVVGRTFRTIAEPGYPELQCLVVAVVKDTKYGGLRDDVPPTSFAPAQQFPEKWPWTVLFIRYSSAPAVVISAVQDGIARANPNVLMQFHVFQTDIENSLVRERTMAVLSGFFGALAALLSTIGLYGIVSYIIAMRTNEMGIRMALGASQQSVVRIILRQTLGLLTLGVSIGIVFALVATRGAAALLFGLQPNDPFAILGAVALLAGVALLAAYVPALRASHLDPMKALRYE